MAQLICTLCGYAGLPDKKTKGNGLIELILWLFFLIPGIIYSIWRRADKQDICPKCGSKTMIPLNTPMGQKMMIEQRNNPDMQITPEEPKKTSKIGLYIMLVILGGVAISLIASFSVYKRDTQRAENELNAQQITQLTQQKKPAVQNLPVEPKSRIETIIKNLGANYEVALFGKNPNVKAIAPFEVIINTDAGNCAFAKQMNFDVMKALFTDPVAKKNIAKVRFNARRYISTSMGGDDARESADKTWAESGPTNFFKVLTQMGSGDLSYKSMERQTWGKPLEGCQ